MGFFGDYCWFVDRETFLGFPVYFLFIVLF